jgi:hypothetical protein
VQESGCAISDGATPGIEVIVADIVFVFGVLDVGGDDLDVESNIDHSRLRVDSRKRTYQDRMTGSYSAADDMIFCGRVASLYFLLFSWPMCKPSQNM